jgi:hypothetical protein
VQEFGSPQDILVRFENKANLQDAQKMITTRVAEALPGVQIRRTEAVGARVSSELFRNGLLTTVATSLTVILSILLLALIGGEVMRGFGLAIIFGIVIGTSSSIFIASPILLFLGEKRLRPSQSSAPQPSARAAAQFAIAEIATQITWVCRYRCPGGPAHGRMRANSAASEPPSISGSSTLRRRCSTPLLSCSSSRRCSSSSGFASRSPPI